MQWKGINCKFTVRSPSLLYIIKYYIVKVQSHSTVAPKLHVFSSALDFFLHQVTFLIGHRQHPLRKKFFFYVYCSCIKPDVENICKKFSSVQFFSLITLFSIGFQLKGKIAGIEYYREVIKYREKSNSMKK